MNCAKYIISLLVVVLSFIACNDNKEDNSIAVSTDSTAIEKNMKAAIAAHPDSMLLKEKLIQYYRDNGEYDLAVALTDQTLKADSSNARLWKIKGTLHFENDDTSNAVTSFEKAVALAPEPDYVTSLGILYAETKNAKALDMSNSLFGAKKESLRKDAFFIRGLYYNYTGDKTKAISNMDSCIALDYTYTLAYREKAIALYDQGKYEPALAVLDKALTIQNNFDEGYYWRGRCLEKLNRKDDAIESYQTALMYSPDYTEAQEALDRLGVKSN